MKSEIVSIFITDISKSQLSWVYKNLTKIEGINQVSVDLEDCDKVLRVVSNRPIFNPTIKLLSHNNIYCEEMKD